MSGTMRARPKYKVGKEPRGYTKGKGKVDEVLGSGAFSGRSMSYREDRMLRPPSGGARLSGTRASPSRSVLASGSVACSRPSSDDCTGLPSPLGSPMQSFKRSTLQNPA